MVPGRHSLAMGGCRGCHRGRSKLARSCGAHSDMVQKAKQINHSNQCEKQFWLCIRFCKLSNKYHIALKTSLNVQKNFFMYIGNYVVDFGFFVAFKFLLYQFHACRLSVDRGT